MITPDRVVQSGNNSPVSGGPRFAVINCRTDGCGVGGGVSASVGTNKSQEILNIGRESSDVDGIENKTV
jgi:hypothetical protein